MNPMQQAAGAVAGRAKVAVLLDYDGTLAPIAPHPEQAVLPEGARAVLRRLAAAGALVGVVSGRGLDDVRRMVGLDGLAYAGGHGLHVLQRDGTAYHHPLPPDTEERVRHLVERLQPLCRDGAWIEDKKGTQITFHYREVPLHLHEGLDSAVRAAVLDSGLRLGAAHCAVEAKPVVQWHKGAACLHILEHEWGAGWTEKGNNAVVYAGDDTTDEDAFRSLAGRGLTIRVVGAKDVPTEAELCVPSCGNLLEVLNAIADQVEQNKNHPK